ncbi:hypothetical protein BD410DRAFT_833795 [Rickenella mellea]|uniref:STB6-like N-terminal domain-containing protein n=1 Tax=Rickenella mellea TaxID=50990 RepID=A0A4V3AZK6_9AGAM|nr:hypothetical protein BD410DRAFT_833795 [Rickenella mellea]
MAPPQPTSTVGTPRPVRRLLVPTSRPHRVPTVPSPRQTRKSNTGRLMRARAESLPPEVSQSPASTANRWFFDNACKFEVVQDELVIDGYQIYAVEKWIAQRTRPVTLLTIYTGDPKDKITVTVLSPPFALPEAEAEWERGLKSLRRDGARPRETEHGVIMTTSLANFRSDYTIVLIPDGNFLAHRERLYANINLLRMGCAGRSALTLQESSDATKDRFVSTYHLKDTVRAQGFITTVLELVKIVQSSLSIFDMFPLAADDHDGLLCDVTVDGIQRWVAEIGEPYLKIEPMERVADPTIVSALLSLLVTMRNKLSGIGLSQVVPKDPFLDPILFTHAIATFAARAHQQGHFHFPASHSGNSNSSSASVVNTPPTHVPLSLPIIKSIDLAYERTRSLDPYKVHRVLLHKLDDFTSATTNAIASASSSKETHPSTQTSASGDSVEPTSDLSVFLRKVTIAGGKDGVPSLRYLWTGRSDQLRMKRKEMVWSDGERDRDREEDRDPENERTKTDGKSTDDEGERYNALPWSNKMQLKIENWAGIRSKKNSVDLTGRFRSLPNSGLREHSAPASTVPSVILSSPYEQSGLSSGQVSPISPSTSMVGLGGIPSAQNSSINIESVEYERRVSKFNKARPPLASTWGSAFTTWSDPLGTEEIYEEQEIITARPGKVGESSNHPSRPARTNSILDGRSSERRQLKRSIVGSLRRRHSFDDAVYFNEQDRLSVTNMAIDVELCGQYLVLRRREGHVRGLVACLQAMLGAASTSNEALRKEYQSYLPKFDEASTRAQVTHEIDEALRKADGITRDTNALAYEALGFDTSRLWQMAQIPRQRVFAIRERVSGTSTRKNPFVHGRYNRVQRTMDRQERLVDWMGRTESEVEDESSLPRIMPDDHAEIVGEPTVAVPKGADGWFLAFFTRWGKVLGVGTGTQATPGNDSGPKQESKESKEPAQGKDKEFVDQMKTGTITESNNNAAVPQ